VKGKEEGKVQSFLKAWSWPEFSELIINVKNIDFFCRQLKKCSTNLAAGGMDQETGRIAARAVNSQSCLHNSP
jgi:hypothetical protein